MGWFIDLPIRQKLILSFGLICAFLLITIFTTYTGISAIQKAQTTVFEVQFANALDFMTLRMQENGVRASALTMTLVGSQVDTNKGVQSSQLRAELEKWHQDVKLRAQEVTVLLERLLERSKDDESLHRRIEELKEVRDAFAHTRDTEVIPLVYTGKIADAMRITLGIQGERFEKMREMSKELGEAASASAKESMRQAEKKAHEVLTVCVIVVVIALIASFLLGAFLSRIIGDPLKAISQAAEKIALGDLGVNLSVGNRLDEVGVLVGTFAKMVQSLQKMASVAEQIAEGDLKVKIQPQSDKDILGNAFASMVENLRQTTGQITDAVNVLSSSVSEILSSTTETASSVTETASAVTETTTTVEEVRQTSQVSNQKAKFVADSAQRAVQISQSGKKSTEETTVAMNRIREQMESIADSMVRLSEQSQAIGEIIATVDDLAQQSNLLAVNASIEAAKAGEQGKGFAVVAQEVKRLAEQSRQATMQVRTILNDVQKATSAAVMETEQGSKAVDAGVKQSSEAGEAIVTLANSVIEAAQAATQIAASNQQQLVGMDQVATAMEGIKEATNQNATAARQIELAARNLNELGKSMKQLIGRYKV